ncbi:MAG: hypothetical protein FH749_16185 [Firmicutes bacterium]|nr:hypothetical protein [Bacillota bacterium]
MRKVSLIICLLVAATMVISGCSEGTDMERLEGKVTELDNKYPNADFMLHVHPDYPIVLATTDYLEIPGSDDRPPDIFVTYAQNKSDLDAGQISAVEEQLGDDLLYGPYEGEAVAKLNYRPIAYAFSDATDIWEFNGIEIEYTVNEEASVLFAGIELQQGGYFIEFYLKDGFDEEDAKSFIQFLLTDLNL